eukprot:5731382-Amphidinium_carterae.1
MKAAANEGAPTPDKVSDGIQHVEDPLSTLVVSSLWQVEPSEVGGEEVTHSKAPLEESTISARLETIDVDDTLVANMAVEDGVPDKLEIHTTHADSLASSIVLEASDAMPIAGTKQELDAEAPCAPSCLTTAVEIGSPLHPWGDQSWQPDNYLMQRRKLQAQTTRTHSRTGVPVVSRVEQCKMLWRGIQETSPPSKACNRSASTPASGSSDSGATTSGSAAGMADEGIRQLETGSRRTSRPSSLVCMHRDAELSGRAASVAKPGSRGT